MAKKGEEHTFIPQQPVEELGSKATSGKSNFQNGGFFPEMARRSKGGVRPGKQTDETLFKDVLQKMNAYRKQGELCDVILIVGDRHFPAHRAILSATCPFFECLLSCEMRER